MQLRIGDSEASRLVVSLEATSIQRLERRQGQYEEEIFVVVSDITDRIKAEVALQESEARWRKYILHAPVGIFVANMKGEYLKVNPAACRITGLSESELLSRSVFTLLPQESEEFVLAHFQKLLNSDESFGEVVYRHPDGDERVAETAWPYGRLPRHDAGLVPATTCYWCRGLVDDHLQETVQDR